MNNKRASYKSFAKACLLCWSLALLSGCTTFLKLEAYCPAGLVEEDGGGFFAERDGGGFFRERDGGGFFRERDGGGFFRERDELINPRYQVTCRRGVLAPPPPQ